MKKLAYKLTLFTFGILIISSINACKQGPAPAAAPAAVTTTSSSSAKEDIVFINSDTLLSKYDYFKDLTKKMEAKGKDAQADLADKSAAFQREVAEYKKDVATMPADQRQSTEERLSHKQQELQGYQQNATAQFQDEQSKENAKLYDKIAAFTKKYAKDKGYKLVLTYSKTNPSVLYGDASLDITSDVAKGLNADYAGNKN